MRVLLRSTKNGKFFKAPGQWTQHPEEAKDFETRRLATNAAFELGFEGVELFPAPEESKEAPPSPKA